MSGGIYELPPILSGSTENQLRQLRDYLARMARREGGAPAAVSTAALSGGGTAVVTSSSGGKAAAQPNSAAALREQLRDLQNRAASLRALIVKTADERSEELLDVIETSVGELEHEMEETYLAQSEFGTYAEQIQTQIVASARAVVESYGYAELIEAAEDAAEGAGRALQQYMTTIDGQIRRGYLTDPDSGDLVLGIAVSQQLQFTGSVVTRDGETYYELDSGQTLGIYTSVGWQFWAGGRKIGWFSSRDGMLHVAQIVVEDRLQISDDWEFVESGGFGLRYF